MVTDGLLRFMYGVCTAVGGMDTVLDGCSQLPVKMVRVWTAVGGRGTFLDGSSRLPMKMV